MTITVHLPDELAERLAAVAARRGVGVDQVATELVTAGLSDPDAEPETGTRTGPRRRLSFAGIGSSGSEGGDIARRHRQIIAEAFAGKTAHDV